MVPIGQLPNTVSRSNYWNAVCKKSRKYGSHRKPYLESFPPPSPKAKIEELIHGALTEIHTTHKMIESISVKHEGPELSSRAIFSLAKAERADSPGWKVSQPVLSKGRVTWVIRDKKWSQEKVERLGKGSGYLYETLGLDSLATGAMALSTYTVPGLIEKQNLVWMRGHPSSNEKFISDCENFKLPGSL
ncbi:hypothetical protein K432DRAFT_454069 [Lepidopterella palustris CBS 459.81]|uniref:Uncharacterized protein n=1 Tax=Lepidopterella palustris CBS 459.81 TaxID=1314670 RepID=A0A8E2EAA2_9PEZI|nr:hypothetical protein K432DRAFT_454069 [Lepidopterella palustris CBS 459.81]